MRFTLACPDGYEIEESWLARIGEHYPDAKIERVCNPRGAAQDADVIYTDVWTSMGQEAEREARRRTFSDYKVDEALMKVAPKHAIVLHCLPAIRGEEIAAAVIDGPQSEVIRQAANRMHAQKGLLAWLLNRDWVEENVKV